MRIPSRQIYAEVKYVGEGLSKYTIEIMLYSKKYNWSSIVILKKVQVLMDSIEPQKVKAQLEKAIADYKEGASDEESAFITAKKKIRGLTLTGSGRRRQ
jgi:outer membrane cobalamin receptor